MNSPTHHAEASSVEHSVLKLPPFSDFDHSLPVRSSTGLVQTT
jgi:hypothetical protein